MAGATTANGRRQRSLLLAIVTSTSVLLVILTAALLVALRHDPASDTAGRATTPGGATPSSAVLSLVPAAEVVVGELVTAKVVLSSPHTFAEVSVLIGDVVAVRADDPSRPLSFRPVDPGVHQVVGVVRLSSGEVIRTAPVTLSVRPGVPS